MNAAEPQNQRIDQWLWYARIFKSRSLATKFVASAGIRVTRGDETIRVVKPSFCVTPGDTLAFSRIEQAHILTITAIGKRRGPASEAQSLYSDQSPPRALPVRKQKPVSPFARDAGAGRPTKKDRRALDTLRK